MGYGLDEKLHNNSIDKPIFDNPEDSRRSKYRWRLKLGSVKNKCSETMKSTLINSIENWRSSEAYQPHAKIPFEIDTIVSHRVFLLLPVLEMETTVSHRGKQ